MSHLSIVSPSRTDLLPQSIFSTTFFNFQTASDIPSAVSPNFWLYWVVTIPVTVTVVGLWLWWDKKREERYDREDAELEKGSEQMERHIMAAMRKRAMTKGGTWNVRSDFEV